MSQGIDHFKNNFLSKYGLARPTRYHVKTQQASRVQDFMNYQITTVMKEYTPEFDQLLFYTGYGGSTFKKFICGARTFSWTYS